MWNWFNKSEESEEILSCGFRKLKNLPEKGSGIRAVVNPCNKNQILIIGSKDNNKCYIFDILSNKYHTFPKIPIPSRDLKKPNCIWGHSVICFQEPDTSHMYRRGNTPGTTANDGPHTPHTPNASNHRHSFINRQPSSNNRQSSPLPTPIHDNTSHSYLFDNDHTLTFNNINKHNSHYSKHSNNNNNNNSNNNNNHQNNQNNSNHNIHNNQSNHNNHNMHNHNNQNQSRNSNYHHPTYHNNNNKDYTSNNSIANNNSSNPHSLNNTPLHQSALSPHSMPSPMYTPNILNNNSDSQNDFLHTTMSAADENNMHIFNDDKENEHFITNHSKKNTLSFAGSVNYGLTGKGDPRMKKKDSNSDNNSATVTDNDNNDNKYYLLFYHPNYMYYYDFENEEWTHVTDFNIETAQGEGAIMVIDIFKTHKIYVIGGKETETKVSILDVMDVLKTGFYFIFCFCFCFFVFIFLFFYFFKLRNCDFPYFEKLKKKHTQKLHFAFVNEKGKE